MTKRSILTLTCGLLLAVFAFSSTVFAHGQPQRYFIGTNNGILRAITGVTWNFEHGYTTELTEGQLKALTFLTSRLGITVTEVPLYHISGKPTCNYNGTCEPELGENPSCPDCKGNEEEPTRSCLPADQTPWGIELIYKDPGVTATSGGTGIDVAVLDTGVYKDHLDLTNRVAQCKDFTWRRGIRDGKCDDGHGHGTHVAGTILADAGTDGQGIYGVAPEANLFAYKVCGNSGSCWADDIATAIRTATDNGTEIISMSLGGDTQSGLIADAIDYATSHGVLVIAAAGNDGPDLGSIDYPGANAKVLAAGAIDSSEAAPDWSSRGVNDGDYVIEEREVEVGTPGVSVLSTYKDGCYTTMSGTSMATPHLSGLAAKLWQGNANDTRTYLQELAKLHDLYTAGDDPATGFGLPQVP